MSSLSKIHWFEPAWSYRARMKSLLKTKWGPLFWKTIFVPMLISSLVFSALFQRSYHQTEFDWRVFIILVSSTIVLTLAIASLAYGTCWYFHPLVTISSRGLNLRHGAFLSYAERFSGVESEAIDSISLSLDSKGRPSLLIAGNDNQTEIGIADGVDLKQLELSLREWFPTVSFGFQQ